MDTRWKNIIKKIYKLFDRRIHIPGLFLVAVGVFGIGVMITYRNSYSTKTIFLYGIIENLCIAVGMALQLKRYLNYRYRDFGGEEEPDYEDWKKEKTESLKQTYKAGGAFCLLALWYLYYLIYAGGVWRNGSGGWHSNYATGYVLLITVLIQFIIAQNVVGRFWYKKLDGIMEHMDGLLQIRLKEALEIEKKSLEKVSRSDQLRIDLITNVSHDLKTPLTSMVGYIELMKKEELSGVVRDYVGVLASRTEKLGEMINSLFSLAKASSGNVELHKENFEVNRLIEQIFADMDDRIKESGLKFVMQLAKESTEIFSDNSYFYRICQNLVENALKYSAKGTRVFVKTFFKDVSDEEPVSAAGRKLRIEITNTAGYLMDFTKEDIVERFARGDKSRTSEGNGLGLAIVSSYTKALGGEFDIQIDCDQFKACLDF